MVTAEMRAWILPAGQDADLGQAGWQAVPGHVAGASWVDGAGDVADTCSLQLAGVPRGDVDLLLTPRASLLLAPPADASISDLLVYGPYDLEPAEVNGEARQWTLSGRIGSHFEATLADRQDEDELYADLRTAVTATLTAHQPWAGWISGAGAPSGADVADYTLSADFIMSQIDSQLVNARGLAGCRQILAQWALTAVSYPTDLTLTGYKHRIRVDPLHRPSAAGTWAADGITMAINSSGSPTGFGTLTPAATVDLAVNTVEAHPTVSWTDALNRAGAYRTRQIAGIDSAFGSQIADNLLLSAGTSIPPVYLDDSTGPGLLKQREEVERWRLQNDAAIITLVRRMWPPYTDAKVAYVTPLQLVQVSADNLPSDDVGTFWQVRQVNHEWDGEEGYRQTIKASLWQGPFYRTSGSQVRAIDL